MSPGVHPEFMMERKGCKTHITALAFQTLTLYMLPSKVESGRTNPSTPRVL